MITSSLPPELKVLIASGFLLGGGLFAQRYPADREADPLAVQTVAAQLSETPTAPTTPQERTSVATSLDEGSHFEPIQEYFNREENRERLLMSMSESDATSDVARTSEVEETPELDPGQYAGMNVEASQETMQRPDFMPFQRSTPVTMPPPNPAFFAERPSPPNLTGLSLSPDESVEVVPSTVVSPSTVQQSEFPANRITRNTAVAPIQETVARPIITPEPKVTVAKSDKNNSPVVLPVREPRGNIIVAPARTTILPNPQYPASL